MRRRNIIFSLLGIILFCLLTVIVYNLPPVHDRLAWRVDNLIVSVRRFINPPEEVVFTPQEQVAVLTTPTATQPPVPTETPLITVTPSLTPTAIPGQVKLSGIRHEYQQFNNCAPANLAMAMSFWGWGGDQYETRAYLRPNFEVDDKNVNPFEIVDFVEQFTGYDALWRVGGTLTLLKQLTAAGFPVLIEKGLHPHDDAWLGHYQTVSGYDDATQSFWVYDSYEGPAEAWRESYDTVGQFWRHFNFVYIVVYPPERADEVHAILGPHTDPQVNFRQSVDLAWQEANQLTGREQYFAWFNLGTNLVYLGDYANAAQAFDTAFNLYASLSFEERPWRLLWYVDAPFAAYYHTGRYQDVLNLAQTALVNVDKPVLEETYYWRGMAKHALADYAGALDDLRLAYSLNPHSTPAGEELARLNALP